MQQVVAQPIMKQVEAVEQKITQMPSSLDNYQQLQGLVAGHYLEFSATQRQQIRSFLEKHGHFAQLTTYLPTEAGKRIVIKGMVQDEKGQAIPHAHLFVFQTDSRGYYAPDDSIRKRMNEADPRLFAYLSTDAKGHYELHTIRPAHYPIRYQGRYIPQHIHFNVQANGYQPLQIQMTFSDDPAMQDAYWQDWAQKLHFPVVSLRSEGNQWVGVNNLVLKK